MFEIPAHGFFDTFFKLKRRFPTQFRFEFGGVDGIPEVVAGTVGDVGDEIEVGTFGTSQQAIDGGDDHLDDVNVFPLIETTDVVGFGRLSLVVNQVDGAGMVFHIKPVAHVFALAVDGERLPMADVVDEERNEFFGKLIRAVVVGAVRHDGRHAVGVVESAHKVVARGFGGRIGRVRVVLRRFEEEIIAIGGFSIGAGEFQSAVHLIGRDVIEALTLVAFGQTFPVEFGCLEERERTHHVGLCKSKGVADGAIHMALGCQMNDTLDLAVFQQAVHAFKIADVHFDKLIIGLVFHITQIGQVARVGEGVEADDVVVGIFIDEEANNMVADKAGSSGDDDRFHILRKIGFEERTPSGADYCV